LFAGIPNVPTKEPCHAENINRPRAGFADFFKWRKVKGNLFASHSPARAFRPERPAGPCGGSWAGWQNGPTV